MQNVALAVWFSWIGGEDNMSIFNIVRRAQQAAEQLMVDTVLVKRITGYTLDEQTALQKPSYVKIYEGKCKLQAYDSNGANSANTANGVRLSDKVNYGSPLLSSTLGIHLPMSVTGLEPGDIVEVVHSFNKNLENRVFKLALNTSAKTFTSAQRWVLNANIETVEAGEDSVSS